VPRPGEVAGVLLGARCSPKGSGAYPSPGTLRSHPVALIVAEAAVESSAVCQGNAVVGARTKLLARGCGLGHTMQIARVRVEGACASD